MHIKNRLYPHPVLFSKTDDYTKSQFSFQPTVTKGIREIILDFDLVLDNSEILEHIAVGLMEYLIHIECSITGFRKIITTDTNHCREAIPEHCLNGKTTLCAFVVVKQDILAYTNSDFNEDYENVIFNLERGSIVAIGGHYVVDIVKDTEELGKIPSIFSICKNAAASETCMAYDIDGEKIVINLSQTAFENYKMMLNIPTLIPVFHSMLIVPALIYVFEQLKSAGFDHYEEHRWFKAITKTLKKHEITLDAKTLDTIPSFELAQKLLDAPIERAFASISHLDDGLTEEI